jgi:hypothetical protein
MSDTNRVQLGLVEEVTLGVTPATPAIQALRITNAPSLAFEPNTVVSEEIRSDRQITDLILVGADAGGEVGFELSFEALDIIFGGALQNTFVNITRRIGRPGEITSVASGDMTVVDPTGDDFVVGMMVETRNFGEAANNLVARAETLSSGTNLIVTAFVLEAVPPANAEVHQVGCQGVAGDITATAGVPNTLDTATLSFIVMGILPGMYIKIDGTTAINGFVAEPQNNDWVKVESVTALQLVLSEVPAGWATDTAVAQTITLYYGDVLVNGVNRRTFTLEEQFTDHAPVTYQNFFGQAINTLSISATSQSIVTATGGFFGTLAELVTTRFVGATDIIAPANTVLNSSSNVARIARGGVPISGANFVLEATVEINNNLRRLPAVGFLGAIDIGSGEFSVTGNLGTYFDDETIAVDVINNAETSFNLIFQDDGAQCIVLDLPRIKFSGGSPEVPGKNQDVTIPLEYQAIRDTALGYTMAVQRLFFIA